MRGSADRAASRIGPTRGPSFLAWLLRALFRRAERLSGYVERRLAPLAPKRLRPRLRAQRQSKDTDESLRRFVVERIAFPVRRERCRVQRVRRASADHGRRAAIEPNTNLSGDEALGAPHVRGEVLVVRREPEPVVYKLCVLAADLRLEAQRLLRQHQRFERPMSLVQEERGRGFVDLARFDPDQAVLDHVDAPHAVLAGELVQTLHEIDALDLRAVDRDRDALIETDRDLTWLRGRLVGVDRPLEDIARRGPPRIFEHPGLDRATPEIH